MYWWTDLYHGRLLRAESVAQLKASGEDDDVIAAFYTSLPMMPGDASCVRQVASFGSAKSTRFWTNEIRPRASCRGMT